MHGTAISQIRPPHLHTPIVIVVPLSALFSAPTAPSKRHNPELRHRTIQIRKRVPPKRIHTAPHATQPDAIRLHNTRRIHNTQHPIRVLHPLPDRRMRPCRGHAQLRHALREAEVRRLVGAVEPDVAVAAEDWCVLAWLQQEEEG